MFSKKAAKIEEIFTVDLTVCSKCQIDSEDFIKFCGLLRKHELYYITSIHFSLLILKIGFSNQHTESKKFQPHGYSGPHAYLKSATNNYLQRQPKAKPLRVRTVARVSAPMLCFEKWGQKGDGTAPLPTYSSST